MGDDPARDPLDDYYLAVGKVTSVSTSLEEWFARVVRVLLGDNRNAQLITAGQSFSTLKQMVDAIRKTPLGEGRQGEVPEALADELDACVELTADLQTRRNAHVHGTMVYDAETGVITLQKPQKWSDPKVKPIELGELQQLEVAILVATARLATLALNLQRIANDEALEHPWAEVELTATTTAAAASGSPFRPGTDVFARSADARAAAYGPTQLGPGPDGPRTTGATPDSPGAEPAPTS